MQVVVGGWSWCGGTGSTSMTMERVADTEQPIGDAFLIGGPEHREILLVPYDWSWPALYETQRDRIQAALGSAATRIEHINVVHLEKPLPLLHVDFVGRNVAPGRRMLSTGLTYRRPVLARLVWALVGPGHRWAARRVLLGAPPGSTTDGQSAGG